MAVHLHAAVKSRHSLVRHAVAQQDSTGKLMTSNLPFATSLVIEPGENGVLLLRYNAAGEFCGDTWHLTVEEAKAQAKFEFEVESTVWQTQDEK
jgi:hypothetical protein